MPVLNTPTVSISLPVPTPVQQKPKTPQPQPVAQAPAPPPTQAPPQYPVPLQPQVSAVILPWTPTPQRMQRKGSPRKFSEGYNHYDFIRAISEQNEAEYGKRDRTPALAYADWLEENGKPVLAKLIRDSSTDTVGHMTYHYSHGTPKHGEIHGIYVYQGRMVDANTTHPDDPQKVVSFGVDLPPDQAEALVKSLGQEGWPAGNDGAKRRMSRRLPKKVIKFSSAGSMDLTHMLQYVRENPYDTNVHGPLADAIDDIDFGNPVAKLIRRHYIEGQGNENLWYDNVYAGWDGTFPYTAKLGRHGPFKIYLGHEGDSGSGNQRWVVHALSTLNGSRDLAYTFEIPHEEAHIIPQLFPAAAKHISPHRGPRKTVAPPGIPTEYTEDEWREREGSRFDWQMDEEHRGDGPNQMKRKGSMVKYSEIDHKAFQEAIKPTGSVWNPEYDLTARKVYADYLDENPEEAEPGAAEILRHHNGHRISFRTTPEGKVGVDFEKTVFPATSPYHRNRQAVVLRVSYKDGRLSISGRHGRGSFGQVQDAIGPKAGYVPAKGWTRGMVKQLREIWERWHLNDMKSGTPAQEEFMRQWRASDPEGYNRGVSARGYIAIADKLREAGLEPDPQTGHHYGHQWLKEDVPPEVLKFLAGLPDSDRRY